jgi:hypothetical protein
MADFAGAVPTRTERDDEFKIKLVDFSSGGTATAGVKVEADGSVNTNSKIIDSDSNELNINPDGSINVLINQGTKVLDYSSALAVAAGASTNFDYVVTDTKTFNGIDLLVGCEAKTKVEFGTFDGTDFTSKGVYFQQAALNHSVGISCLSLLGNGTDLIRVIVTNKDKQATDIYCAIQGTEY